MTETFKKYWVNGYQIRGSWFKSYTLNIGNIGVMFMWGKNYITGDRPDQFIRFYKLIK